MVALVPASTANGSAPPLVILLVEDEVVVRWSIAEALRDAGYTVVEAGSGEEAIAICASDVSVDLLFTDINLTEQLAWRVSGSRRPAGVEKADRKSAAGLRQCKDALSATFGAHLVSCFRHHVCQ
jgi:CheY-like chemotaxis protein